MSKKIFTKLALKNSLSKPIYFEACITNFTKIQTKFLQNPEGERGGGERENRLWSEAFQSTPNWHKGRVVLSDGSSFRDILVPKKCTDQNKVMCFQLRTINMGQDRNVFIYLCSRKCTFTVHWHNIIIISCLFSAHLFLHWSPLPQPTLVITQPDTSPRSSRSKTSDC